MTTQFELWFEGGSRSIVVKAPRERGKLSGGEEIDGLDSFIEYLSSCEWFYDESSGRMIHVRNIDFVTIVKERYTGPVDD